QRRPASGVASSGYCPVWSKTMPTTTLTAGDRRDAHRAVGQAAAGALGVHLDDEVARGLKFCSPR
ncbi:MAG: hypothetical protein ACRDH5_08240, partial [bacterium]